MKIVMSVSHYPPTYVAGVELYARRLARWLAGHGHSVEVVCVEKIDAERHPLVQTDEDDGVIVHRLGLRLAGTSEHLGMRFRDEALGEWFADYLGRTRPDLLHSHSSYLLSGSLVEAAKRVGIPVVITLHDSWFFCSRINLLRSDGERCVERATPGDCTWCLMAERRRYRLVDAITKRLGQSQYRRSSRSIFPRWPLDRTLLGKLEDRESYLIQTLKAADKIVIIGQLAGDLLAARGIPSNRVQFVTPGIDLANWQGRPRPPRQPGLRVGYLGQVAPHKGIHVLIDAFSRVSGPERSLDLQIYGDLTRFPEYVAELHKRAAGNPRIRLCGPYDNRTVEDVLSRVDVVVVPSVCFETRPVVMMEAAIARVPTIASCLPNMQYQIRHGVDGLLFAPGDADDLARQIQRLLDEPGLLERLAEEIQPVRTTDDELAELEDIYHSITVDDGVQGVR